MAFNPFSAFRRHQRVLLAGVTIMAMLSFIMCTGMSSRGGDAMSWLLDRIGVWTRPKTTVALLYGREVTAEDLAELRRQRRAAISFLDLALRQAMQFYANALQRQRQNPGSVPPLELQQYQQEYINLLIRQSSLRLNHSDQELLDFQIWLHQADQLGIQLTADDVLKEVQRLASGRFTAQDAKFLLRMMNDNPREFGGTISEERLYAALADELRVRIAQSALEGWEPGGREPVPAAVTPYEFWEYYKDHTTLFDVALLTVPVADFVPKVQQTPSEEELRAFYEAFRNDIATPDSDRPGFKQPRRVQVQWVSTRPDAEVYRQAARVVEAVTQATLAWPYELQLRHDYEDLKRTPGLALHKRISVEAPELTEPNFLLPYFNRWDRPELVASLVGQAVGLAADQGSALGLRASVQAAAVASQQNSAEFQAFVKEEIRRRLAAGLTFWLGTLPSGPDPWASVGAWCLAWVDLSNQRQHLPLEHVRAPLRAELRESWARQLALSNLRGLKKEIEDMLRSADGRRQLPTFLEGAIARRGLRTGAMTEPKDEYTIVRDAGIQPLREAFLGPALPNRQKDRDFAQLLFGQDTRPFQVAHYPRSGPNTPVENDSVWQTAAEPFLFWKTRDEPATAPASFEAVRDQVEASWRKWKARDLARQEAERLAAKARPTKGDIRQIRDLSVQELKRELIPLEDVAKLKPTNPSALVTTQMRDSFEPYQVPESKVANPADDFLTQLFKLKDKELGESVIVTDKPKEHFYVAVLYHRREPSIQAFYGLYREESSRPAEMRGGTLLARFEREQRQKFREQLLQQLRQQAGLEIKAKSSSFDIGTEL
ncbi:MAG: hypothetical protein NZ700_17265 [Gemmataceae bacterium]|nr:hypothetical protein [Gemmataceae bacterium]MDW8264842.1 hypothetical protein [Gemmataceae bacterium]